MSEDKVYPVTAKPYRKPLLDKKQYAALYRRSVEDPEGFWAEQAEAFLSWDKKWDRVLDWDYPTGRIRWFEGGRLNVSVNCLDRHLKSQGDRIAIIWEGDDPSEDRKLTYRELYAEVCRCANVLKARGVKKGDRVCIYMPMVPEAAVAMLACARIGAVHSVVFGGFSPESIKDRILDSDCRVVITADEGLRGNKRIPLKANMDEALVHCPNVHTVLVLKRTGGDITWNPASDFWWHEQMVDAEPDMPAGTYGRGRSAVHPLYLRFHRQAQGRAAYLRRLSPVCGHHPQIRVRLSGWRHLLVHRGRRLGHGPFLYRLRPAVPTAPPLSCSKACRTIPARRASGK